MELQSIDMLDMLDELVNSGKKSLMSNKVSVDRDEMLALIEELRQVLPEEIVQANAYYKESRDILENAHGSAERILAKAHDDAEACRAKAQKEANLVISDAHADAELIIREAENKRMELIDAHEITQRANEQARLIVDEANSKARDIRKGTREYMDGRLLELSQLMAKLYNEVEQNRKAL